MTTLNQDFTSEYVTGATMKEVAEKAMIEAFNEAWRENYEFDRQAAQRLTARKREQFFNLLANDLAATHGMQRVAVEHCDLAVRVNHEGKIYVVKASTAIDSWDLPKKVRVIAGRSYVRDGRYKTDYSTYRARKNGTFNFAEISAAVARWVRSEAAKAATRSAIEANKDAATYLRDELKVRDYGRIGITASDDAEKPIRLVFKIDHSMTAEKARRLVEFLKAEELAVANDFSN